MKAYPVRNVLPHRPGVISHALMKIEYRPYIGLITHYSEENNDYHISFLEMDSKYPSLCSFPKREDKCWVKQEHILEVLSAPNIVPGVKIIYSFSKKVINEVMKKLIVIKN